jgi:hypothetical protein
MRTFILLGLAAISLLTSAPASARPCKDAIFFCNGADARNLVLLRAEHRSNSWIQKHCDLVSPDPPGCAWSESIHGSSGGSSSNTLVLSDADPAPAQPPIARDPKGRVGPTPSPAREIVAPLADDGPFASDLAHAAARYKLPVHLLRAVMQVESNGNPLALSNKGAVGLMQLLPSTAQGLGVDDIHDTAQNIMGGARFLRILANRFEGDLVKVLSAYHAGSMRVAGRDATPFAATDDYVRKVLRLYYTLRDGAARKG